jgi:hypothetical protein
VIYRKGKDSLRKFGLARVSNDERISLLCCFKDYSAGRKEPLKFTTDYAFTEGRARDLLDASVVENVKKVGKKSYNTRAQRMNRASSPRRTILPKGRFSPMHFFPARSISCAFRIYTQEEGAQIIAAGL